MYTRDEAQDRQELRAIEARRAGKDESPPVEGLVGLALSGGGIRSATFGLGVLERLKQIGLLERIDYLSTVSGGGYIGGWLSANCVRRMRPEDDDAVRVSSSWLAPGTDWKLSIAHLRRFSNYLSPKLGLLSADTWTMGTIWLRNALLMQAMIVLMIGILLLLPRVIHPLFVAWPTQGSWRWLTVALFSAGAAGIARNQRQLSDTAVKTSPATKVLLSMLACLCIAAIVAIDHARPNVLFSDGRTSPLVWLVAMSVLAAAYILMPFIEKVTYRLRMMLPGPADDEAQEADYGQGAVQRFVVIPLVVVGFLLGAVLWGQSTNAHGDKQISQIIHYGEMWQESFKYWQLPLVLAFCSLFMFAVRSTELMPPRWPRLPIPAINWLVVILATLFSCVILHSLMSLIMMCLNSMNSPDGSTVLVKAGASWRAMVWAPPAILFSFSLAVIMLIGIQGVNALEAVREWWSRMGAWLCIYGMAWMVVMVSAVYGPMLTAYALDSHSYSWVSGSAMATWIATTMGGILAGKSGATGTSRSGEEGPRNPAQAVLNLLALAAPVMVIVTLLITVSSGIHVLMIFISKPSDYPWPGFHSLLGEHWTLLDEAVVLHTETHFPTVAAGLLAILIGVLAVMIRRVDINEFSLNAFYRSRLARCYLGATRFSSHNRAPQRFIGFDEQDDLPLAKLGTGTEPPSGPFHIFNCALNLGGSSDLSLHTRQSATFTLTPSFAGSCYSSDADPGRSATGLCPTAGYGKDKPLTVAKAMAVSGAAASPNMGFHTSPLVAFVLTLFNVRLGWWFPRPGNPGRTSPRLGLMYLLSEMFGVANERSDFLMISDGGHFENLAAYELVARRCRVIIIVDAECDPQLKFDGLGTLIRMCEVDHDTKIAINVEPIRTGSQTHAVGTISYPGSTGGPAGILIYLKAAMTGNEGTAILQYRTSHPSFPHESTGNQFYGEDQFESYRSLGFETADRALKNVAFSSDVVESTAARLLASCPIT
jgi:hypothetical protein